MGMDKQSLVEVIQESLKLLNEYNVLCGRIKQLAINKDKDYYMACHKAYNYYQRCHRLIFQHVITMDEFISLKYDHSQQLDGPIPSLMSVYDKLRNLLLTDTQIETIKFEYYNSNMNNEYMNKLVTNSWISMSFINNILNQKDKLTLIIEADDHLEDTRRRKIIPCQNYVRLPTSLINEGDSIGQLEFNVQDSTHVLPSETLLFRDRNKFDYIILITTDVEKNQEGNMNVFKMLVLFEKIVKNLTPRETTRLFPSIFISIMDFNKWDIIMNRNVNKILPVKTLNNTPNSSHQNRELIVGIHNQSNSCYINSILQSLLGTTELIDAFLKISSNDVLFHPSSTTMVSTGFIKLLGNIIASSNKSDSPINIEEFKRVCGNKCSKFKSNEQEDCAEFCQFLLDTFNDELKVKWNTAKQSQLNGISPSDQEWLKYLAQNNSIITQLFVGQLSSILHCQNCGASSTTYQTFSVLSLPTPPVELCNIMECFRQCFRPHDLGPSNQWNCTRCRRPTPSTQQLVLGKKPKIMMIQLNRFDNHSTKNNCFVHYPIHLDQQYIGVQNLPKDNFKYELYSVVCHRGSINNGHYTTYVNKGANNGWYYFDDTVYRPVRIPTEFITPDAYLLFYRLIQE
ncbi:hypothetical protein MOSE0_B04104 [Monosporozyma servazzii]